MLSCSSSNPICKPLRSMPVQLRKEPAGVELTPSERHPSSTAVAYVGSSVAVRQLLLPPSSPPSSPAALPPLRRRPSNLVPRVVRSVAGGAAAAAAATASVPPSSPADDPSRRTVISVWKHSPAVGLFDECRSIPSSSSAD